MMASNLLKALRILEAYEGVDYIAAEHDELYIGGPTPDDIAPEDAVELEALGFTWTEFAEAWQVFV